MFEKFIHRPVLSLVISLLFLLVGGLALTTLPVTQFPDIVPPSVTVTAKYTGANAEVCAKAVAIPIERAINGVPGMTYMSSVTSNSGLTLVTVYFNVGVDPDIAAVNVQNRVSTVLDELPEEVIKAGVQTEKEVNSILLYLNLYSEDSTVDEKFVYNFADINLIPEIKRIEGVGYAEIMGSREYSMRVWLNPEKMMAFEVSAEEVIQAIRNQNVEAAPGRTGESSEQKAQVLQYTLKYGGKFTNEDQYLEIPIRNNEDGSILRLKDIATVEFGSESYAISSKTDGRPSASILIKQRPGSNAAQVINNIKKRMEELKAGFPPGLQFNYAYDVSRFLDASIHEVIKTLIEAFILVSLIVFLFLQDWRSTLIPALAVPVSLIGTFAFLDLMGFSINLLTLFAMVLAIGIVVDNAIVVVEAVHAKMHFKKLGPKAATVEAMSEISGAIIAITLVMSAVFVPVAFMSGPVGIFYRQFSLTLAIAIVISGINALTLTPALCAILLKQHHQNRGLLRMFFAWFNKHYDNLARKYGRLVAVIASRRLITFAMLILFFGLTWTFNNMVPSGFIPTEDQGIIYVNVTTPPGSTVERTESVLEEVYKAGLQIDAVENVSILAGYSIITEAAGASYGMAMINLKAWDEREENLDEVIALFKLKTAHIAGASIEFFPPPTVPGFGNASGFELRLIDKSGRDDLLYTSQVTNEFIDKITQTPEVEEAFTSFDVSFPQYELIVDYASAARKGVSVDKVMSELQTLVGSYYTSNFIRYAQMRKVMVQASPEFRKSPEDILQYFVKNDRGEMVPINTFIRLERVYGPEQITRYNMAYATLITGDAADGFSSGQAIKSIERVAKSELPMGFRTEWSGLTREEILAGGQTSFIFIICLIFVYLILSAQYESFLLPMVVIFSLPTGIFGSYMFLELLGLDNNIYAQVALVMLIGLLGKNAILIVEFSILKQKEGLSVIEAAVAGASARFRPIIMTSVAFVAGLIPLLVASGAGAMGNRSIGSAAAGGMITGTLFGVIIIPGLYVVFAGIQQFLSKSKKKNTVHETS